MRPRLLKRSRRRLWGGVVDIRVLQGDGGLIVRVRSDHPSNDPEVEMAMAGRVVSRFRSVFKDAGLEVVIGPMQWRDDPPKGQS